MRICFSCIRPECECADGQKKNISGCDPLKDITKHIILIDIFKLYSKNQVNNASCTHLIIHSWHPNISGWESNSFYWASTPPPKKNLAFTVLICDILLLCMVFHAGAFLVFSIHSHLINRMYYWCLHNIIIVTLLSSRVRWKYAVGDVTMNFFNNNNGTRCVTRNNPRRPPSAISAAVFHFALSNRYSLGDFPPSIFDDGLFCRSHGPRNDLLDLVTLRFATVQNIML